MLGPVLFTAYIKPLSDVISSRNLDHHFYADDSQLWIGFNPRVPENITSSTNWIEQCLVDIKGWMDSHYLKMNASKTEVLIISTPQLQKSLSLQSINLVISGETVEPSLKATNLGVTMDSVMGLDNHVNKVCRTANYQLRNIYRIRKYLDTNACRTVVQALVTSRLDYCNGLLMGASAGTLRKLQLVQNRAARIITRSGRGDHISPVLVQLHWLPVEQRVIYKTALLTYKALHGLAPQYLADLLEYYVPTRSLRSADQL